LSLRHKSPVETYAEGAEPLTNTSRRRTDSTSFAAKCSYWGRRLGETNPQRYSIR